MLTLPEFELFRPSTVREAVEVLAERGPDARIVAGGTDILVNMKHGIVGPDALIDVTAIEGLGAIEPTDEGGLRIGALVRLADLADSRLAAELYPSLVEAVGLVAGPQHRNMGTIGGNVCLDTRCVYINQTHFWRRSLGYCLKKDGTQCHVVAGGQRCVAAQSSDSVPVLMSLDARVRLESVEGARTVPVGALYRRDGVAHLTIRADELLTHIDVPPPWPRLETAYRKLRVRKAIDYPVLSIALAVGLSPKRVIERIAIIGTALMATPRRLSGLDKLAVGQALEAPLIDAIAERAHKQFVPLTNILVDPEWRREMVPVLVRRAFGALRPSRFISSATPS